MENVQLQEISADEVFEEEQSNILEVTLKEFDEKVEYAKDLVDLLNDPKFIRIISDNYIEEEAERLGGLLTTTSRIISEKQSLIVEQIVAKRHLRHFLEVKSAEAEHVLAPGQREALVAELEAASQEEL